MPIESPSLARAVFASGTFAEGWAVYVTQVLMDLGYRDHEPALMLTHWKFYLRAITNAIMDVAIHTEDMTEEEAMAPDGRRRLPGAGRGARQMAARAAHLDPAVRPTTSARSRCGIWRSKRAGGRR